jgi:hypothetical protein
MTITRADIESILVRRASGFMAAAGLAVTVAGSNADLNDPLGWALRKSGITPVLITAVADADVAKATDVDQLLDLAELRLLENIYGNLTLVDITLGPRKDALGQIGARLEKRIDVLREKIDKEYGIGASILQGGVITLDFADHNEGVADDDSQL